MNYDSLRNMIGNAVYLLVDPPRSVSVQSVNLDENGIEIILERGIDAFAEDNRFELAEEIFPAENDLPACLVTLATSEAFPVVRAWQFDDIEEATTK